MPIARTFLSFGIGIILFVATGIGAIGQQYLDREMAYSPNGETGMRKVLEQVAEGKGFYFSYPAAIIPEQKAAPSEAFKGSIGAFLKTSLGDEYEFKELPGYIIIRFSPKILDVEVEVEKSDRQATIKGRILDHQTSLPVPMTSIYERTQLVSTISNQEGYFELKLRNSPSTSLWVTLSKENYRDTSFYFLPTVDIKGRTMRNRLRFAPETANAEALEGSFFGRMFIGFRQRVQRINLGGFLGESPYQMSLIPGLGSQGMFSSQMVNRFSLNLIGGYSAGTEGFETAGVFNINQNNTSGFQAAGMANLVGGEVNGMQVAGLYNRVYRNTRGVQIAGLFNHIKAGSLGWQFAGIYNKADSSANHQVGGLVNQTRIASGLQIGGLANLSPEEGGLLQIAGLLNSSGGEVGYQISGLANKASKVSGMQLGLLNWADSSDYSIGLVSFVKNGRKSLAVSMDESAALEITLRTGGRKLYSMIGLGYLMNNRFTPYAYSFGIGLALTQKRSFSMDLELYTRTAVDFSSQSDFTNSLRLLPAIRIGRGTSIFAGPSVNFAVMDNHPEKQLPGWVLDSYTNPSNLYGIFAGLTGGIQFHF
jgi:hypothetical protein